MKYEVINISTTSETYIANGILTHNKPSSCIGNITSIQDQIAISFGEDYVPAYPLSLVVSTEYTQISDPYGCKRFEHADGSVSKGFTVTDIGQTYPYSITVNFRRFDDTTPGALAYTASVYGQDNNGQFASASAVGNIAYSKKRFPTTGTACLTLDTLIEKYDGNTVFLNEIEVGQELVSIDLNTMEYIKTTVTGKTYHSVDTLYLINYGALRCSESHRHIVKRNNEWHELQTNELFINDILLNKNFEEIKITSIDILK